MDIGVGNEQDRLMFKRIFILYIQMAFLLPTTINKISHVHLAPIFDMDTITERNWGGHVLRHNPKRKRLLLSIHLLNKINPIMGTVLCKLYYRLSS
ncbi:hypothetical protein Ahy_B10g102845 [Arachis hypogaea]|uniref:Uncharacterized protein n=1 Tax=Arachis hypogaea TaxID=3818 RepID=A0A444X2K2_ARAHY|nr:hypothetical protein Ahy_B10g102845 [Arachis hypogaea]